MPSKVIVDTVDASFYSPYIETNVVFKERRQLIESCSNLILIIIEKCFKMRLHWLSPRENYIILEGFKKVTSGRFTFFFTVNLDLKLT